MYSRRSSVTITRNLVLYWTPLDRIRAVVVAREEVLVVLAEADPVVGYAFVDFGFDARAAGIYDAGRLSVACCLLPEYVPPKSKPILKGTRGRGKETYFWALHSVARGAKGPVRVAAAKPRVARRAKVEVAKRILN